MIRFVQLLLVIAMLAAQFGCQQDRADVTPTLTPEEEQEILDTVHAAANSEQEQAAEK